MNYLEQLAEEIDNSGNRELAFLYAQEIKEYTDLILQLNIGNNLETLLSKKNEIIEN